MVKRKTLAIILGITAILATHSLIAQHTSSPIMTLVVDEAQAFRQIAFVHESIHVRPGPLALAFPRWIPGEHGPTGPIHNVERVAHI